MYAFDARVQPAEVSAVFDIAVGDVISHTSSSSMGSEVKAYRQGTVSLVLISTEALSPLSWLVSLYTMETYVQNLGSWGYSFQISEGKSGDEIGFGRLKGIAPLTASW